MRARVEKVDVLGWNKSLTVLQSKSSPGFATITNNKIRFSAVWLSITTRLIGKFAFKFSPFYPNQCIFLGGTNLGNFLAKLVDVLCLIEHGFN